MTWRLVYDAATMSDAPQAALRVGLGMLVVAGVWSAWHWRRGESPGGLQGLIAVGGTLVLLSAAANAHEKRGLATRPDLRAVEGRVTGMWQDRTHRDGKTVARWEGFRVAGLSFVYQTDIVDNYFKNVGGAPLVDGAVVRLRYFEEGTGSDVRRRIVRVETAAP